MGHSEGVGCLNTYGNAKHRVSAQTVVVIHVFITLHQTVNPLGYQVL